MNLDHLNLLASTPDFSGTQKYVVGLLNAVLTPVIIIIAAICVVFIIKNGFNIKKYSEDPELRMKHIYAIIWCFIGLGICIFAPVFVNVILPELMKAGGAFEPPSN